jgi:hypothetical protein
MSTYKLVFGVVHGATGFVFSEGGETARIFSYTLMFK